MIQNLRTTAEALSYWKKRTETATTIAQKLVSVVGLQRNPRTPVLYAVWLGEQEVAAYFGQSLNGYRRLWDLAIGESHHFANTFAPEIWGSVAVIRWFDILGDELPALMKEIKKHPRANGADPLVLASLGFEHLFLQTVLPLFNCHKRSRDGKLLPVALESSKGRGAIFAPVCRPFSERLFARWDALQKIGTDANSPFASRVFL